MLLPSTSRTSTACYLQVAYRMNLVPLASYATPLRHWVRICISDVELHIGNCQSILKLAMEAAEHAGVDCSKLRQSILFLCLNEQEAAASLDWTARAAAADEEAGVSCEEEAGEEDAWAASGDDVEMTAAETPARLLQLPQLPQQAPQPQPQPQPPQLPQLLRQPAQPQVCLRVCCSKRHLPTLGPPPTSTSTPSASAPPDHLEGGSSHCSTAAATTWSATAGAGPTTATTSTTCHNCSGSMCCGASRRCGGAPFWRQCGRSGV